MSAKQDSLKKVFIYALHCTLYIFLMGDELKMPKEAKIWRCMYALKHQRKCKI